MRKRVSKAIVLALALAMTTPSVMPPFVTSVEAAAHLKMNKEKITLYVGKTYALKVSGTSKSAQWSSSKQSVATVSSSGKVSAKKEGTTTITAKIENKEYTCKVTVKAADQTTAYGKVTAVSGSKVTIALGTMNKPDGTPPSGTGSDNQQGGTPPSGTGSDNQQGGTPPSGTGSNNQQGGAPDFLTLTGKSVTITISDTSILSKESMGPNNQNGTSSSSTTASLSDITVGTILRVTYKSSIQKLVSVVIMETGQPGGSGVGTTTASTGTGAYNLTNNEILTGGTYSSTNNDENAIRAENSITATLSDVTVNKTGGTASSNDGSSFYGLNAAVLALKGAILNITGGSVTAKTEGSNGVFAYNGATINIKDTTINVTGGNAGGIEVAGGGILNATNLTVNSSNKAAIRSDRGGGTITVNGGTYTTSGSSGAPAIYSTASITANDATLTSNNSEAVVVEGLNSVTLNNCNVTGNMSGTYGANSGENIHNVMLYQSMSGDAEVGNSSFTMSDGSLTSKNGDMFYITNTDSVISLSNVALTLADGTKLLTVAGNDGTRGWGKAGSNGGNCTFNVSKQTLSGDISVDKISKLTMSINNSSSFKGSINSDGTTASALSVTLDSTSTWTLTADSYVTAFSGSMSNVNLNGHTLYVNGVAKN